MEGSFVILLDLCSGCVNIIKLTKKEIALSEKPKYEDDFESFLKTLEKKYGFCLDDCEWMACDSLQTYCFKDGKKCRPSELGIE